MSTFAPAGRSSTGSTSTAPSTASQPPSDAPEPSSDGSTTREPESSHDPNVTWGWDDPLNPDYEAPEGS